MKLNSTIDDLISAGYTPEDIARELTKAQGRYDEKIKKEAEEKARKEKKASELKAAKQNLNAAFTTYLSLVQEKTFTKEELKNIEKILEDEYKYLENNIQLMKTINDIKFW